MANIRIFNPWSMLPAALDDVNDITNRVFSTVPAINVYEENEVVHVELEVPGFTADDLDISVTGDILKITGKVMDKSEEKKNRRYYISEISEKSFTRTVTLPYDVIAEDAKASFSNGMLHLTLPKSESAKPKSIKIG